MKKSMVMAMDRNRLIGREGGLPWKIPADMRHFRRVTTGCPILVGRRTFVEDIGRPLPGRETIVISRDPTWRADGVHAATSLEAAWPLAESLMPSAEAAHVIGGAVLCRAAIASVDLLHLTVIDAAFEGDTWFDSFEWQNWNVVEELALSPGDDTNWPLTFYTLVRRGAPSQEIIT